MYHLPISAQQLVTNESSVYLGTGEVFSIPPEQMKITGYQFGGARFFKSRVTTEYGSIYVDDYSGRPFLLDNQLNDLSLEGMRNFWQEHGKLFFDAQYYAATGEHYPNESTASPTGIGYLSTYDPRFKRFIIHKRDFKITPEFAGRFLVSPNYPPADNSLTFNGETFYYTDADSNVSEVSFNDSRFFENKS